MAVEWRVLFGDPDLRQVAGALQAACAAARARSRTPTGTPTSGACAAGRPQPRRRPPTSWSCTTPARSAWPPWLDGRRWSGAATWTRSSAEAEALERVTALIDELPARRWCPDESFAPDALRGEPLHAAPPGIDPLDPRNLELEPRLPGRVVRPLGVDLDRPFCCRSLQLDRWNDPHSAIEAFRLAQGGGARAAAGAGRRARPERRARSGARPRRSPTTPPATAGRAAAHRATRALGSLEVGALQHLARVALRALAARGLRPRALRGALEADAGGRRHRRRPAADGARRRRRLPRRRPRGAAARLVELVRDPGWPSRWAAPAASGCASASSSRPPLERELRLLAELLWRRSIPWSAA